MIKKQTKIVLCIFFLATILFSIGFSRNFILLNGDTLSAFYPTARSFHGSNVPLWEGSILSGFPMAASFQYGFYNPLNRLAHLLLDFITAYHALIVFYFISGALLTYVFARRIGLSQQGASLAGVTFALAHSNVHWASNIAVTSALVVLPAAFLAARAAFFEPRWPVMLFGIILGISFLGAHQQFILMALLAATLYFLFLAYQKYKAEKKIKPLWRPLAWFASGCLVGLILGAPQLLYTLEFTSISSRLGGISYPDAAAYGALPLDIIKFVFPHFSFRYGVSPEFLPYVGILPFLLAGIASWKLAKKQEHVWFFFALSVFAIAVSVKYSPIFWLMHKLPILEYFRGSARWSLVLNFAMAFLAGYGLDWVINNFNYARALLKKIFGRISVIVCGLSATAIVIYSLWGNKITDLVQDWFDRVMYSKTTGLSLDYYHALIAEIVSRSFANFMPTNPKFFVVLVELALVYVILGYIKSNQSFAKLAVTTTAFFLFVNGILGLSFMKSEIITQTPQLAKFILEREHDPNTYRIFSFLSGTASSQKISAVNKNASKDALEYTKDALVPNTNIFWNIDSIDGYEPMAPQRIERMLAYIGSEVTQAKNSFANESFSLTEKLNLLTSRLNILSMLNVKYLISAYELPPTTDLEQLTMALSTRFRVPIYLYENKNVMPRVYLAPSVKFISDTYKENTFDLVVNSNSDFYNISTIECADCKEFGKLSRNDSVSVGEYKDGYLKVTTQTTFPRWLIFSESNLPGWRFTIDGKRTTSKTANYLFHGILLPAGRHELIGEYRRR